MKYLKTNGWRRCLVKNYQSLEGMWPVLRGLESLNCRRNSFFTRAHPPFWDFVGRPESSMSKTFCEFEWISYLYFTFLFLDLLRDLEREYFTRWNRVGNYGIAGEGPISKVYKKPYKTVIDRDIKLALVSLQDEPENAMRFLTLAQQSLDVALSTLETHGDIDIPFKGRLYWKNGSFQQTKSKMGFSWKNLLWTFPYPVQVRFSLQKKILSLSKSRRE